MIVAALIYALLFAYFDWGAMAAYVLALLPAALAYLVSRTWLASAFVALLPGYFVIGRVTEGWHHHAPYLALDHVMTLGPSWMLVYGSLYVCAFLLPILVVRGRDLFRQTLKAYLFVMLLSYAIFFAYPTVAPRDETIAVRDFATWSLRLFYDIDQPYGCFPSLHVAYSFVAAFACLRMHRGVGLIACAWAALIGVSTVYTKQHYVVDAVAGAAAAIVAAAMFLRGRPPDAGVGVERILAPRRALYGACLYAVAVALFWTAYRLGLGPVTG